MTLNRRKQLLMATGVGVAMWIAHWFRSNPWADFFGNVTAWTIITYSALRAHASHDEIESRITQLSTDLSEKLDKLKKSNTRLKLKEFKQLKTAIKELKEISTSLQADTNEDAAPLQLPQAMLARQNNKKAMQPIQELPSRKNPRRACRGQ